MDKTTLKRALICALLLLLLAPATLLAWGFGLPCQYGESFLGELGAKCALLDDTAGPRIVVVGGSSVAFGVDSAALEGEFPGYRAVNFGLYAALGTQVMLELSLDGIRPGDIVILSPEQQAQTLSCYFNAEALWQGLDGSFPLLGRLDRSHWGELLAHFPTFAAQKLGFCLTGEVPVPEGVYRRSSFDVRGDIRNGEVSANVMAGLYDPDTPIRFDPPEEAFIRLLNDYAAALTARGAVVYYRLCPMNRMALEPGADLDAYYDLLQARLDFPILGDPNRSVLDPEWFYDTNFHLNAAGRTVNTYRLVRDLKAQLGDASPTEISLPDAPEPALPDLPQGDNRDSGYFLYRLQGEGAILTGVTQQGKQRDTLTVPTHMEGVPVTAIADFTFDGCAARVIVVQTDRPVVVGQHLLDGTQAVLQVPEGARDTYKLNYFWSLYAGKISSSPYTFS